MITDPDLGELPAVVPPGTEARILIAARVGTTRLIDNMPLVLGTRGAAGRSVLMLRTMMKSKIHRATVTQADLHYVGSVTVDEDLLDAADLLPGELVHIVDITNGARLETYTIAGERGSGVIGINGAAARLVHPGDLVILIAYGQMETAEARELQPHVVFVDADNRILATGFDPAEAPAGSGLVRGDQLADALDCRMPTCPSASWTRPYAGSPGASLAPRARVDDDRRRRRHRLRHRRADRRAAAARRGRQGPRRHQGRARRRLDAVGPGRHRRRARPGGHPRASTRSTPWSPAPARATATRSRCW